MTPNQALFAGIFLTAFLTLIGWFFNKLVNIISAVVVKLDVTITRMDERFNAQATVCGIHRETFTKQNEELKDEIGRVEDKVDKVEKKIDNHITRRRA